MNKNILIFSALAGIAVASGARANTSQGQFDIDRVTYKGDFSATFGAQFVTGMDSDGDSQTAFSSGRVDEVSLYLNYKFADEWTLIFDTDNSYADSEIGLQWNAFKTDLFNVDFVGNYGIAWTKDEQSDVRYGQNNFDAGFIIHGRSWRDWQWSFETTGQFVFADTGNFWNINMTGQLMYYFHPDVATLFEYEYNLLQINRPATLADRTLTGGLVYNWSDGTSINPFAEFHLKTDVPDGVYNYISSQDYWEFGLNVSTKF